VEREVMSDNDHPEEADYVPKPPPPPQSTDYIDRKMFEGKWAEDREEEKRRNDSNRRLEDELLPPPPGTESGQIRLEDTDDFLDKVKGPKKDDGKGRKSFNKPSQHFDDFE
jgi:hypothetical protein